MSSLFLHGRGATGYAAKPNIPKKSVALQNELVCTPICTGFAVLKIQNKRIMVVNRNSVLAVVALCGILLLTASCKTPRVKRLEAENAKLQSDIVKSDSVQIQFMNAYAEIEANLNEIKLREKMINENSFDAETNADIQQRIINDIMEIGNLMEANRQKLQEMEGLRRQLVSARTANRTLKKENEILKQGVDPEAQVRLLELEEENSRLAELNQSLEETVSRLKDQLAESEARIEGLQEELAMLKDAYAALQAVNDSLQKNERAYLTQIQSRDDRISELTKRLSASQSVYYVMGTSKTLKNKGIVVKNAVNPNLRLQNLTEIRDYTELNLIETKSSKVELISNHPSKSYKINSRDKKNLKIEIVDSQSFWSTSRVCVIEVK